MKTWKSNKPNRELWPKATARVPPLEFRRAPLLAACCWFALGEAMARHTHLAVILLISMTLLLLLSVAALRWSLTTAIFPLAALWIAAGFWSAKFEPSPPAQHALAGYADGLSRQVRGRVLRIRELPARQDNAGHDEETGWWPEKSTGEEAVTEGAVSVDVQVDAVEEVTPDIAWMAPVRGGVRMNIVADRPSSIADAPRNPSASLATLAKLRCGDVVQAPMRLRIAERYRDPGAWQ